MKAKRGRDREGLRVQDGLLKNRTTIRPHVPPPDFLAGGSGDEGLLATTEAIKFYRRAADLANEHLPSGDPLIAELSEGLKEREAMLEAMQHVVRDYVAPPGKALERDLHKKVGAWSVGA